MSLSVHVFSLYNTSFREHRVVHIFSSVSPHNKPSLWDSDWFPNEFWDWVGHWTWSSCSSFAVVHFFFGGGGGRLEQCKEIPASIDCSCLVICCSWLLGSYCTTFFNYAGLHLFFRTQFKMLNISSEVSPTGQVSHVHTLLSYWIQWVLLLSIQRDIPGLLWHHESYAVLSWHHKVRGVGRLLQQLPPPNGSPCALTQEVEGTCGLLQGWLGPFCSGRPCRCPGSEHVLLSLQLEKQREPTASCPGHGGDYGCNKATFPCLLLPSQCAHIILQHHLYTSVYTCVGLHCYSTYTIGA